MSFGWRTIVTRSISLKSVTKSDTIQHNSRSEVFWTFLLHRNAASKIQLRSALKSVQMEEICSRSSDINPRFNGWHHSNHLNQLFSIILDDGLCWSIVTDYGNGYRSTMLRCFSSLGTASTLFRRKELTRCWKPLHIVTSAGHWLSI